MNIARTIALGAVLMGLGITGTVLEAQSVFRPPAELPPASFTGSQFADSTGCIYVRAGSAGAVQWVPRVTRDRQPLCGFQPSFSNTSAARAPAPAQPVVLTAGGSAQPSSALPAGSVIVSGSQAGSIVSPDTRILPQHLFEQRQNRRPVKTPKGYKPAWDDGRMNPRRAEGTPRGEAQMNEIWTQTVPRRQIISQ